MSDDVGEDDANEAVGETSGKLQLKNVISHLSAARKALDDALVVLRRNAARRGSVPGPRRSR